MNQSPWINKRAYIGGLTCVGTFVVLVLGLGLGTFHGGKPPPAQLILVHGIGVPKKEDDDFLVYSDQGVFRVADTLLASNPNEDPLFIFALGTHYRVETRESGTHWLGASSFPVITQAVPVVSHHRDKHVAGGNRTGRVINSGPVQKE